MAAIDDCCAPPLMSDSGSECTEDINENEWYDDADDSDDHEEMNMLTGNVTCLFCTLVEPSVESLLSHCSKVHSFDLVESCTKWSLDCISYIKMVNYIRQQRPTVETVEVGMACHGSLWSNDVYMKAFDNEDLMLQFDIEWAECHLRQGMMDETKHSSDSNQNLYHSDEDVSESKAVSALVACVRRTEADRDLLREELDRALEDIQKLKLVGQQLVLGAGDGMTEKALAAANEQSLSEKDGYFASYGHHDIHMTMLKDKVRTESYRDFIMKNRHLFEGKLVLDVGCGTGILSMFAAKAGAQVVAVDQSSIIYQAMDIARENNLHDRITFVKGRLEAVTLPIEKFDIIISEWMGYFLLFEAMLDSVLWARDRYLAPGGCVYPDHFSMFVVGVSDLDMRKSKIEFWDDVYGFKMSCMKSSVVDEVYVKLIRNETVVTEPAIIKDIDVMTCKVTDLEFSAAFSLKCQADADITAIVGYFNTDFAAGCHTKVSFSTGPHATPTHWEQAVMLLPTPIPVKQGSSLDCHMTYRKHPQDSRGIIINLRVGTHKLRYSMS
ncbi:hypothetical protein BsWGS_13020 [Bradybaena similaris]